jgi:maleate isomerase
MAFSSWRGTVGLIKPTMRPGNLEELIRMLPRGISVIPLFNDIREGSRSEFERVIAGYEAKTAALAEIGVDLIHPAGAPPFMLLGYDKERALIAEWEHKYGVQIFTSGTNHCAALRALGVHTFVGVSYFRGDINATFAQYFRDAGFEVIEMAGMDIDFDRVQELSGEQVYRFVRDVVRKHPTAGGIYLLGPSWQAAEIVDMMECDFGIPVIYPTTALCWEMQQRLHVRQPVPGLGRLLREMPALGREDMR